MRLAKRVLLGLMFLVGTLLVLAVLGALIPNPFVNSADDGKAASHRILVVSNPIHTDIAIPVDSASLTMFAELAESGLPVLNPDARWLLIGWGARSFYLETPTLADMKPGPTFRALTLDSSVMHVDVFASISQADPSVTPIDISDDAYSELLSSISNSFTRKDNRVIPIEGYKLGLSDKFFEGEGVFNALMGCNVWTSSMLRSAGIRTGLWNPLPISLGISLGLFNTLPSKDSAPPGH